MALTRPRWLRWPTLPLRQRLVAQRALVLVALTLAFGLAAQGALANGPGRRPHFLDGGADTLFGAVRLLTSLPRLVPASLVIALALALYLDVRHSAGALSALAAARRAEAPLPPGLRPVLRIGAAHTGAFWRILLLVLTLDAAGVAAIGAAYVPIQRALQRGYADGEALLGAALARASIVLLWVALVGAFGLACRALTVADGRRLVRRTAVLALRASLRRPIALLGVFVAATLAVQSVAGLVLVLAKMNRSVPAQIGLRGLAIVVILGAQALLWRWLLERTLVALDDPRFAPLRATPDLPLAWHARLWRRLRRRP